MTQSFRGTVIIRMHCALAFSISSAPQRMETLSEPALVLTSNRKPIQAMHRNPKVRNFSHQVVLRSKQTHTTHTHTRKTGFPLLIKKLNSLQVNSVLIAV